MNVIAYAISLWIFLLANEESDFLSLEATKNYFWKWKEKSLCFLPWWDMTFLEIEYFVW